jgi:hypothetical protein
MPAHAMRCKIGRNSRHPRLYDLISGTDREISANIDRQASATNSVLFPWSLPTESEQNRLLICFVPPRSDAVRNLVPRFDRASNCAPDLPLSSLAVGRERP